MKLCFHIWVYAFVLSRGTLCASVCEGKVAPSPFGLDRAEASALDMLGFEETPTYILHTMGNE